jgi:hypothetical protein
VPDREVRERDEQHDEPAQREHSKTSTQHERCEWLETRTSSEDFVLCASAPGARSET